VVGDDELPVELRLWDAVTAGEYLGIPPNTVLRLAREGDDPIPSIELGDQTIRFLGEELRSWAIRRRRITPASEGEAAG
jgi:hypothetical protein